MSNKPTDRLTSDQVRIIGLALNDGYPHDWRARLADLTGASPYTIRSWCEPESSGAHRVCSGPAARFLRVLYDLKLQGASLEKSLEYLLMMDIPTKSLPSEGPTAR